MLASRRAIEALERLVNEKVESGLYQTASEVIREGLRPLKERDHAREQLRGDVQAGFDQLSRGEAVHVWRRRESDGDCCWTTPPAHPAAGANPSGRPWQSFKRFGRLRIQQHHARHLLGIAPSKDPDVLRT